VLERSGLLCVQPERAPPTSRLRRPRAVHVHHGELCLPLQPERPSDRRRLLTWLLLHLSILRSADGLPLPQQHRLRVGLTWPRAASTPTPSTTSLRRYPPCSASPGTGGSASRARRSWPPPTASRIRGGSRRSCARPSSRSPCPASSTWGWRRSSDARGASVGCSDEPGPASSVYFLHSSASDPVGFAQLHFSIRRVASVWHCWSTPAQLWLSAVQVANSSKASVQSLERCSASLTHCCEQSPTLTAP